jgi:hypothetical protein
MLKIKTMLMAAAVSTGAILAMPAASQAMPTSLPVQMNTVQNGNIVNVRHRYYRRYWHDSEWHHHHHHHYLGFYPYYGYGYGYGYPYDYGYYEPYPYYGYYPRYYRPRYYGYGPGIGFSFRF